MRSCSFFHGFYYGDEFRYASWDTDEEKRWASVDQVECSDEGLQWMCVLFTSMVATRMKDGWCIGMYSDVMTMVSTLSPLGLPCGIFSSLIILFSLVSGLHGPVITNEWSDQKPFLSPIKLYGRLEWWAISNITNWLLSSEHISNWRGSWCGTLGRCVYDSTDGPLSSCSLLRW